MRLVTFALILVTAGCGAGQVDTTGPPTTSSTTTTATSSTTTTEPVGLEALTRFTRLEPGVRYLHRDWPGQIVTPLNIEVGQPGWRVDEIGRGFIQFRNSEDEPGIRAAVVAFNPNESVAAIIDNLTNPERAVEFTEPEPFSLGGFEGLAVNVLVPVDLDTAGNSPNFPRADTACIGYGAVFFEEGTGQEQSWFQILAGCGWNGIWVIDVDGLSMTLTVSPEVVSRQTITDIDELGPYVDDFVGGIKFCTSETPCDD